MTDKIGQDVRIAQQNELGPAPQLVVLFAGQAGLVPADEIQTVIDQLLEQ